jgi:hypothetical protein
MPERRPTAWRDYEEVATYLLNHVARELGLERVEGKQLIRGQHSVATWEIDAKGICSEGDGIILVECRRYPRDRLDQEAVGGFAYRIRDCGANGGILVSPLGLQEGAKKVAAAEGIISVQLDPNSTTTEFLMRFLHTVMIGVQPERLSVTNTIISGSLEEVSPDDLPA